MDEHFARLWADLGARVGGPLSFRLVLQPAVAAILAIRAGLRDARTGRPFYFWTMATHGDERRALLVEGWKAIMTIFLAAIVIDAIYQVIVMGWVYPGEALLVAFLLACVPYVFFRSIVNRWKNLRHPVSRNTK